MNYLPAIFAFLVAGAGAFYLFGSRAAHHLAGLECPADNRRRIRLRRANGLVMILLGAFLFSGFYGVDSNHPSKAFLFIWLCVCLLLAVIVFLVLIDLRLTWKMRQVRQQQSQQQRMT